jgi:hypothetical protein
MMIAKMVDAMDRRIPISVNGMVYVFELSQCTEEELENFKILLMWTLQDLLGQRDRLYEAIAKVNGELDRRVNEAACGNNPPLIPSQGGNKNA